jgi:ATP-dependent Clp protease ATP-binding subunit ClpC
MFERVTDSFRKNMALANMEAQAMGHEYIGTEHILLAILKENAGIAAAVLARHRVTYPIALSETEKLIRAGNTDSPSSGKLPLVPRAKIAIEYAIEEARNLSQPHVGTEHLLLGLLRDRDGLAACILLNLKVDLAQMTQDLLQLIHASPPHDDSLPRLLALLEDPTSLAARALTSLGVTPERLREEIVKLRDPKRGTNP